MKAEKFLLDYMLQSDIPVDRVKNDVGIDMEELVNSQRDLMADELIQLCIYLGVDLDDMVNILA